MNFRRVLRYVLIIIACVSVAFLVIAWRIGSTLVAPAHHTVGQFPAGLGVESVIIPSASGASLAAWYVPANGATATVLLLHPIRSDRRSMVERAKLLHAAGYATLLIDFQAHGESTGDCISAGYFESLDVASATEYIRMRSPNDSIGIVGWSLGGASTLLATPLNIDALVIESVYPTITEAIHNRISMRFGPLHHLLAPALLVQLNLRLGLSPSQLRPIDRIATVGCPVLVASGDLDLHTTLAETERLFNTAVEPKKLVVFSGAAHSDLLQYDPVRYRNEVIGFLDAHLRKM